MNTKFILLLAALSTSSISTAAKATDIPQAQSTIESFEKYSESLKASAVTIQKGSVLLAG